MSFTKNGLKTTHKESIIDGAKGLSFSVLHKEGEAFHRLMAKQLESGEFEVKEKKNNDDEVVSTKSEKDVMAMVNDMKELKFVADYVKKDRKKYQEGGKKKKATKKSSKKSSKKPSKKSSKVMKGGKKKSSKKSSKKTSKKTSKVSKKNYSKKTSKKGSKKGSYKGSN